MARATPNFPRRLVRIAVEIGKRPRWGENAEHSGKELQFERKKSMQIAISL
jgi:hypothetical protein